ncbi:MAG: hypothetical protein ROM03_09375 [Mucispirillum sp.]|nr:hypothetical protein [Mucispirillum sp.]
MLDDIISKFAESKNMTNFDFSLRPNHDIDNPFAKTSIDIIDSLQQSIAKADKSVLADVLLDEAKENINFSYKIFSQIVNMTAEDEGLLFKARLIEILNELESKYDNDSEQFSDLLDFAVILTNIIEHHINADKLKKAFITTLLLFETAEEMKIRNIHIPFTLEFKEYIINNHLTLLHVISTKAHQHNDSEINNFFINEILQYINKFSYNKNIEVCFDMLYFASLLADKESAEIIYQAAAELQKHTSHSIPKAILNYINAGIIYADKGSDETADYVCKNVKDYHCISNIAYTCILVDDIECAEKILEFFLENKRIPKQFKLSFYQQLQIVYSFLQNEKKFANIAKERFALGDKNAYFDAVEAYTSLGVYQQEKAELHSIACKQVPIYDYCSLLSDNKEFALLLDRFNMIKSTKDISEAVKFMDDKGIALYDDNTNKKLLNILEEKTKNYKKLAAHVKSLLDLITI